MNKGIYGCRPNRRAIDPVFVDVTQTELSMITRKILVRFNNDATACFDRILVHILTLCLQSFGMQKNLTTILGNLLNVARYAIKTGIGISKETYQYSTESPVFGSGQGSAASAQGWGKIASKAFDAHDAYGFGCIYNDPWKTLRVMLGMLGYVDDNNITNNGEDGETVADVIKQTQFDAQLWNDLLRATGGALNLDKCFAQVLLEYKLSLNGGPVIEPADPNIQIVIQDRLNKKDVIIKPISPFKTYSFLGTKQGVSKNQRQQHQDLMKKSSSHVRKLVCSAMSPRCAWVHYTAVFQSSIGYPLSMCHMSPSQLHGLQQTDGSLEIACVPQPTLERSGDEYIMDIVCSPLTTTSLQIDLLKIYTDMEIRKLFWCKSYLQVKRISDLCTADGTFILPNVYKGERSIRQSSSRLEEINQHRPNEASWGIWRNFLKTICSTSTDPMYETCQLGIDNVKASGKRLRLRLPLGDWQVRANKLERLWPFYYSNNNNVLYRSYRNEWHTQGTFHFDCHQGKDDETFAFVKCGTNNMLPDDAVPVDVFDVVDRWRISFYQALDIIDEKPIHSPSTFLTTLMQQPDHISQYYTQIDFHTVPVKIYEHIKPIRKVYVATDGGAIPFKGSLGFVLADDD
jgi:hypothetical protein